MATPTQQNRLLTIESPLGNHALLVTALSGHEEISALFRYQLEMLSQRDSIPPKDIIGKNVTIKLRLADGESFRCFNGFVRRFSAGRRITTTTRRYEAEVVPWLWFLSRTTRCRVFQDKTVPEIIEEVFRRHEFSDYEITRIKGDHKRREYCVQHHETDFHFVSRLMEQEGIFYCFRHRDGQHTLVLADQTDAYEDCPEDTVDYEDSASTPSREGRLTSWEHEYEVCVDPGACDDVDEDRAGTPVAMEEDDRPHDLVRAAGTCKTFTPGSNFTVGKHDCRAEQDKTYVITSIHHAATEPAEDAARGGVGPQYSNTFRCIAASATFRPEPITPKPVVQGCQTAVVVGPPGEEIWVDKHGRVKAQFSWGRDDQHDEDRSCWIPCMQTSADKDRGTRFIPRVGQEVVVSFLEGDPDRPLISGLVDHGDQIRRGALLDERTERRRVTDDRDVTVQGSHTELIGGDMQLTVGKNGSGGNQDFVVKANKRELIGAHSHLRVKGNRNEKVDADRSVVVAGNLQEEVGMNHALQSHLDVHIKAGVNAVIEAGTQLTLKVGGSYVSIDQSGVTIQGTLVNINSPGSTAGSGAGCRPIEAEDAQEARPKD